MTSEEQVDLWVEGKPIHNHIKEITVGGKKILLDGGECCPDFSCCQPKLLAPKEVRVLFKNGSEQVRYRLLMEFLGKMIATIPNKKVHIAGLEEARQELD